MRIKFKKDCPINRSVHKKGTSTDVPQELASRLVTAGYAEVETATAPAASERAVSPRGKKRK